MAIAAAYSTGAGPDVLVSDYTQIITGLQIEFTDNSAGGGNNIVTYLWDFDDTNTSALPSPTHIYAGAGTYNVSLTVTDDIGNVNTTIRPFTVTAANIPPVANFTSSGGQLTKTFTDTSTDADGTVDQWLWDFGD